MNEFDEKMQYYRQRKARNISLAVMGYFIGVVCIIGSSVLWGAPIAGVMLFLVITAASTGLIIYTKMSTPLEYSDRYRDEYEYDEGGYDAGYATRDVSTDTVAAGESGNSEGAAGAQDNRKARADSRYYMNRRPSPSSRMFKQIMEIYWLLVTVIYFAVSFLSGKWAITWLIWLIGVAVQRAIHIIWETRRLDDFGDKR